MNSSSRKYAPYFRNGKLYIPEITAQLLMDMGLLDYETAEAAANGLLLDEDRDRIAEVSSAMEALLSRVEEKSTLGAALASEETRFMLTGRAVSRR